MFPYGCFHFSYIFGRISLTEHLSLIYKSGQGILFSCFLPWFYFFIFFQYQSVFQKIFFKRYQFYCLVHGLTLSFSLRWSINFLAVVPSFFSLMAISLVSLSGSSLGRSNSTSNFLK